MWLIGIAVLLIALHVIGFNVKELLKILGWGVFAVLLAILVTINTDYRRAQKNRDWEKERDAWIAKQPPCEARSLLAEVECKKDLEKEYERKNPKPYPEN